MSSRLYVVRPAHDNAAIHLSAPNTRAFLPLNAPRLQPYGKVLSSAGNSLKEILTNINTMHGHIKMGYFSEVHTSLFLRSTLPSRHGPPPRAPLALLACSIYFYFIYTNIIGKKKKTHQLRPPTFRITREKANQMQLHYMPGVPTRKGLSPLVVGTYLPANARVVSCHTRLTRAWRVL